MNGAQVAPRMVWADGADIMMKLRYLFHNEALARMLLENWEYDRNSTDLFENYRISANALYPFRNEGETYFLRFCPASEKPKENILAELEFIGYLRSYNYGALVPVRSKSGEELVVKSTPWGEYYASVFIRVPGNPLSETPLEDEIVLAHGAALGRLHKLSCKYGAPQYKRWSHRDVFEWIEATLCETCIEENAFTELGLLRRFFSEIPCNSKNYGLVHYDFELDNVFYDPFTRRISVIDFDDAMYHWYAIDVEQALDSLKSETDLPEEEFHQKAALFLEGYRSQFELNEEMLPAMPALRRFVNLYGYTRIVRSIQEVWENEPEWLVRLREKLQRALERKSAMFGKSLPLKK